MAYITGGVEATSGTADATLRTFRRNAHVPHQAVGGTAMLEGAARPSISRIFKVVRNFPKPTLEPDPNAPLVGQVYPRSMDAPSEITLLPTDGGTP